MAAARHHRPAARYRRDAHEHGLEAQRADAQAHLIILGHAGGDERPSAFGGGEAGERAALDGAADAGQRDRGADRLAHHQFLAVALGEFVAIMAADPLATSGSTSGSTGNWMTRGAVDQLVEQRQLERVDHVLGIVQHDRDGRAPGRDLIGQQRIVEMVQAVGLGGRAIGVDLDRLDAIVGDAGDRRRGRRVVAIMTDEEPVIAMLEPLQRRLQHGGDDRRFVPGGNEDGDEPRLPQHQDAPAKARG